MAYCADTAVQANTCAALHAGVHGTQTVLVIIPYKNPLNRFSMRRFFDRAALPDRVMHHRDAAVRKKSDRINCARSAHSFRHARCQNLGHLAKLKLIGQDQQGVVGLNDGAASGHHEFIAPPDQDHQHLARQVQLDDGFAHCE
jgi:hypothetical protein